MIVMQMNPPGRLRRCCWMKSIMMKMMTRDPKRACLALIRPKSVLQTLFYQTIGQSNCYNATTLGFVRPREFSAGVLISRPLQSAARLPTVRSDGHETPVGIQTVRQTTRISQPLFGDHRKRSSREGRNRSRSTAEVRLSAIGKLRPATPSSCLVAAGQTHLAENRNILQGALLLATRSRRVVRSAAARGRRVHRGCYRQALHLGCAGVGCDRIHGPLREAPVLTSARSAVAAAWFAAMS